MPKPNILYLHSHDTGRYIQPYGYAVPTPNLQRFAEQGVVFRRAFNGGPTCSPSRACLLTGSCAHRNGMLGLAHRGFSLNNPRHHLLHTLRDQGYSAVLSGIQHIAHGNDATPAWKLIGYDRCLGEAENAHERAAEFLTHAPDSPFFLSVGFIQTHRVFPGEPARDPAWCRPPEPLPDTPETRLDMARFMASAKELDRRMGTVLEALDRSGRADNTLVICTTDHGIAFPRMKCNLTDPGIGVMLMMRGPGGFRGGRAIDGLVSQIDLFPTLCDLLDIPVPAWVEGVSLLPLVRGETEAVREEIFSEINYHAAYEPQRCVRTDRWKYIRRYDDRQSPVLPNCDDGESKQLWLDAGWRARRPEPEALYDLIFDPNEADNRIGDPACAEVLAELRGRLDRWMEATGDPLRDGPVVPAPEGAVVNDPDGLSPSEKPRRATACS